jgi:hypothetical protein
LVDVHRRAAGFNLIEVKLGGLHVKFALNELDFWQVAEQLLEDTQKQTTQQNI